MQYLLLIHAEENGRADTSEADLQAMYGEYAALTEDLRRTERYLSGNQLQPVSTATTVRIRNGETMVTDGPFAETKEQLGGYYLVDCASLDEALEIAARIPAARHGSVEVRPVVER